MKEIHALAEKNGAIILANAWLAGEFASKERCITSPETIKGQVIRAAGPAFENMLAAAGASISSMPSSEIYTGMQTGVLDAANTSNDSFVSYRLYEQVKCLTAPGDNALWFMYEPVLISKRSFERLTPEQQEAMLAAASKAEAYFAEEGPKGEKRMNETFAKASVEVVSLSKEEHDAWMQVARESSYQYFAEKVKGQRRQGTSGQGTRRAVMPRHGRFLGDLRCVEPAPWLLLSGACSKEFPCPDVLFTPSRCCRASAGSARSSC